MKSPWSEHVDRLTRPGAPFELVNRRVLDRDVRVYAQAPTSLREVWLEASRHGEAECLVFGDERVTFADQHAQVVAAANYLHRELKVAPGDRVAVAMRNYPEFVTSLWAVFSIGAVAVPLNAWWSASELTAALRDSGAVVLVADQERAERVRPVLAQLPELRVVVAVRAVPCDSDWLPWERLIGRSGGELPAVDPLPDDPATILYTSGTTNGAKGVLHTHRNHCSNIMNALLMARVRSEIEQVTPGTELPQSGMLGHMPLFHIGMIGGLLVSAAAGGKVVLTPKWDPAEALELLVSEKLTSFGGVPLHYQDLFGVMAHRDVDLSGVTTVEFGGMAAPPALVSAAQKWFGPQAVPKTSYGMTEASSGVTFIWGTTYVDHPDSVGWAGPSTAAKVVGRDDCEVPRGSVGELLVSGPNIVQGYWRRPEETAVAFTDDGWHRSGDLATMDPDGLIRIVGRSKDVVIRSGENIACEEVEAVLYEHPAVEVAAVFGIPHPRLGEELVAVVNVRDASVEASQLQELVRARLAHFKVPSQVLVTDEPIPRNATGKLMKRTLQDWVREGRIFSAAVGDHDE